MCVWVGGENLDSDSSEDWGLIFFSFFSIILCLSVRTVCGPGTAWVGAWLDKTDSTRRGVTSGLRGAKKK